MAALGADQPRAALQALARELGGEATGPLPLDALERMVDAYRASPAWGRPAAMELFITAMEGVTGSGPISDGHLQHLLRSWTWRYGDASPRAGRPAALDVYFLPRIAETFAYRLRPSRASESRLRMVIGTLCKAPEGMPARPTENTVVRGHALHVALGLAQVMISANPIPLCHQTAGQYALDHGHLRQCVQLFLQQSTLDPRWKAAIFRQMAKVPPSPKETGALIHPAAWKGLLLEAGQAHLAEVFPDLPAPSSIDEVITALQSQAEIQARPGD